MTEKAEKKAREIAQFVIDNRYGKGKGQRMSDFELFDEAQKLAREGYKVQAEYAKHYHEQQVKKETIRPELFEVKHEYGKTYVIAYDMVHALQSIPSYRSDERLEVSQLTGGSKNLISSIHIAKECLPQGLVNKTIDDNKSKT